MFVERLDWLARPWFLTAVALLALNDHVLKAAWPGLVTGKLSDFAGLAAIATLGSVLVGRTWGVGLAAVAFTALKTVPGVAEIAAPFLGGGVTLRDPTDLVALAVLPGLWFLLTPPDGRRREHRRRSLQSLGLVAGVLAVTATSAPPPTQIDEVGFRDGAFHAAVYSSKRGDVRWLRSTDGGLTWNRSDPVELPDRFPMEDEPVQACADDGVCYRLIPQKNHLVVERRQHGGEWAIDGELPWTPTPVSGFWRLSSVAVNPLASEQVVIAHEDQGFVRMAAGQWDGLDLIRLADDSPELTFLVSVLNHRWTIFALGLLLSVVNWLIVPWRPAQAIAQVVIAAATLLLSSLEQTMGAYRIAVLTGVGSVSTLLVMLAMRIGHLIWQSNRASSEPPDRGYR